MRTGRQEFKIVSVIACFIAVAMLSACADEYFKVFEDPSTLCETYLAPMGPVNRSTSVDYRYRDLFERQPNYNWFVEGKLWDENGRRSEISGIIINVTERVDQSALPAGDRIPNCIEEVPVQIIEQRKAAEKGLRKKLREFFEDIDKPDTCAVSDFNQSSKEETEKMTDETIDKEETMDKTTESAESIPTPKRSARSIRAHEVRLKYDPLFWRQPNVFGVSEGFFQEEGRYGEHTDTWGIKIKVTKKVEQSTLPPEDRIPDCLEGVPVELREYTDEERPIPINELNKYQ